jgi:hypothetical protein
VNELGTRIDALTRRFRRLGAPARTVVGLLAVYAPLVLVFAFDHRHLLARAYLVAAIWAAEAIVWYWLDGRAVKRAEHRRGAGWHPEAH